MIKERRRGAHLLLFFCSVNVRRYYKWHTNIDMEIYYLRPHPDRSSSWDMSVMMTGIIIT
jgi:hypothetical protein